MSYRLWCRNTGGNKQLSFRPPDSPRKVKLSSKSDAQMRSYYNLHAYVVIAAQYDFLLYCQSGICTVCFALNCQYLYLAAADAAVVLPERGWRSLWRSRGDLCHVLVVPGPLSLQIFIKWLRAHTLAVLIFIFPMMFFFFCNHIRVQTVKG